MNDCWSILDLEPTTDLNLIKSRYSELIKKYRPETDQEKFTSIRQAYNDALNFDFIPEELQLEPELSINQILSQFHDLLIFNEENRNDLNKLQTLWHEHQFILENHKEEFTEKIFDYLLYNNYIRNLSPPTDIDIYMFLIDQLIPTNTKNFLYYYFNNSLIDLLLEKISKRRLELRIAKIEPSQKNHFNIELQILAEDLFQELIIPSLHYPTERLQLCLATVNQQLYERTGGPRDQLVLGNVVFEYLLKQFTNPNFNLSKENMACISKFYKFRAHKKKLLKIFSLEYAKQDVLQMLHHISMITRPAIGPEIINISKNFFLIIAILSILKFFIV